jgi:hypothetical protein
MDAHFSEYLAAVRSMQKIYGERAEDLPTEFHREVESHAEAETCQECLEGEKVPATKNGETGILPRFGGWHHFHARLHTHGVRGAVAT